MEERQDDPAPTPVFEQEFLQEEHLLFEQLRAGILKQMEQLKQEKQLLLKERATLARKRSAFEEVKKQMAGKSYFNRSLLIHIFPSSFRSVETSREQSEAQRWWCEICNIA